MMARSQRSNKKPYTLMQDRSPPTRQSSLATHGRTIHQVITVRCAIFLVLIGGPDPQFQDRCTAHQPICWSVAPQTLFWDIDALVYISMGISSLFAALAFPRGGPGILAREFLLSNGILTPVIAFIYFYPHFSVGVLLLGLPWLVTAPGSLFALARHFRELERPQQ